MPNINGLIKPSYCKGFKVLSKNPKLQKASKFGVGLLEFLLQNGIKI